MSSFDKTSTNQPNSGEKNSSDKPAPGQNAAILDLPENLSFSKFRKNPEIFCNKLSRMAEDILALGLLPEKKAELLQTILHDKILTPDAESKKYISEQFDYFFEEIENKDALFHAFSHCSGLLPLLYIKQNETIPENHLSAPTSLRAEELNRAPRNYEEFEISYLLNFKAEAELLVKGAHLQESLVKGLRETQDNLIANCRYLSLAVTEIIEAEANLIMMKEIGYLKAEKYDLSKQDVDLADAEMEVDGFTESLKPFEELYKKYKEYLPKEYLSKIFKEYLNNEFSKNALAGRDRILRAIEGMGEPYKEMAEFGKNSLEIETDLDAKPQEIKKK